MKIENDVNVRALSDTSLVVQLGEGVSETIHKKVVGFVRLIEKHPFTGLIEVVPSYNNVTVFYDPLTVMKAYKKEIFTTVSAFISEFLIRYAENMNPNADYHQRLIEIPVVYGGKFGPDLEYVASYNQITPEKVVEYHTEQDYLVYMIGFAPGFPFLGGINKHISTPRKKSPRPAIPKGTVGIAGQQTGIYPFETPGGWQLIGRTAIELFTPETAPPTLLEPGDRIRFIPITEQAFHTYKESHQ